ncbi:DNA topoisomerase IV, alpha subunit [Clavulina sp. PMI_390]|nr:DNA topoisomerase IV, alpha subunit [Clavulina sp. PMI_390]
MCHQAVTVGKKITKREIYYHDVELFGKQSVVDDIVDDLAATLKVTRSGLHVIASPKGMLCGSKISFTLTSGTILSPSPTEATIIPPGDKIIDVTAREHSFGWVLVVEKEAIFQTLCDSGLAQSALLSRQGLIITGKGQPDLATRKLLCFLDSELPDTIPIFLLVDGDPFGLEIVSVYKFGSFRMRHEAADLICERAELLGLLKEDLLRFRIPKEVLLPLGDADIRKARTMLHRDRDVMPSAWKSHLTYLLRLRRKAELEAVSSLDFSTLQPAFLRDADLLQARPEISVEWNSLRNGPLIVPYLIAKLSPYLPPIQHT